MAEIKLNKPLYEEKSPTSGCGGGSCPSGTVRKPRAPRPHALARVGAGIIDLLALHFLGLLVIRFASPAVISLGEAAPWVGLAVGWLYFAIGASALTGGRTLGKLILQLRTVDVAGPDLGLGRAMLRSALILWPLAVFLVADRMGERLDRPDELTLAPLYGRFAGALVFGWWLGNVFFAALDAHGRSLWDRLTGAIVITSDCEAEALGAFMRSAREDAAAPAGSARSIVALAATLVVCVGFFGWLIWREAQRMAELSPQDREHFVAQKKRLYVEGFGQPVPLGPTTESAAADDQTSTAHFQYRRRGPVDAEALKKDPAVMSKARDLADVTLAEMRRHLAQEKERVPLEFFPAKVRFDVGFASYCDLLFSWDSVEVLTLSHTVALRAELEKMVAEQKRSAGTSADAITSPTTVGGVNVQAERGETSAAPRSVNSVEETTSAGDSQTSPSH